MLQAMNTGHDGSLTTLHAGSEREAVLAEGVVGGYAAVYGEEMMNLANVARYLGNPWALMGSGRRQSRGTGRGRGAAAAVGTSVLDRRATDDMPATELAQLIHELTDQMHQAATDLHFELAARLRDEIAELKKELRQMREATS